MVGCGCGGFQIGDFVNLVFVWECFVVDVGLSLGGFGCVCCFFYGLLFVCCVSCDECYEWWLVGLFFDLGGYGWCFFELDWFLVFQLGLYGCDCCIELCVVFFVDGQWIEIDFQVWCYVFVFYVLLFVWCEEVEERYYQ